MAFFRFSISADGEILTREDLTAQVDGEKTTFIISAEYTAATVRLYWNGIRQRAADTFTEATSTTITTTFVPQIGDTLSIDYTPS